MDSIRRILDDPSGEKKAWALGLTVHALIYTMVVLFVVCVTTACVIGLAVMVRALLNAVV
jgi:hypothetical protein